MVIHSFNASETEAAIYEASLVYIANSRNPGPFSGMEKERKRKRDKGERAGKYAVAGCVSPATLKVDPRVIHPVT